MMVVMNTDTIYQLNNRLTDKLSIALNFRSDGVSEKTVNEISSQCGISKEQAFSFCFAALLGFDVDGNREDKEIFHEYFPKMLKLLDTAAYTENPYYKNIRIPTEKCGNWEFKKMHYKPYEVFVRDDFERLFNGQIIPKIGYFDKEFEYPAVTEDGVPWMTVTPNEVETMRQPINSFFGDTVTFGLGLGYFAYMVSEKKEVSSVTIVEKDENAIRLFENYILPQFKNKDKVNVVKCDAFDYIQDTLPTAKHDCAFVDLWHDARDGLTMYEKIKRLEELSPETVFYYWIEPTLKCYQSSKNQQ